jgi:hypothetical protein
LVNSKVPLNTPVGSMPAAAVSDTTTEVATPEPNWPATSAAFSHEEVLARLQVSGLDPAFANV